MPVSSKELLEFKATIEWGFTLKRVLDIIRTYGQIHSTDTFSQHKSIIWPFWLNGWVFVYELGGCGLMSHWSYLNSRYRASFGKKFLEIQTTIQCGFTLKDLRDLIETYSLMHCKEKFSQHSSSISASLTKWSSIGLQTKSLWVGVPLESLKLQIW